MSPQNFCFVVVNYARPWNIPIIVNRAIDFGFGDVLIWNNQADPTILEEHLERAMLQEGYGRTRKYRIGHPHGDNHYTMGRYVAVQEMTDFEFVATCDDDYLVTGLGWEQLLERWDGEKIVAQLPYEHNQYHSSMRLPYLNIGYGSLFDLQWAKDAFCTIDDATDRECKDLIVRKADRCFTSYHTERLTMPATFGTHLIRLCNPDGQPSETDENSIHLTDEHRHDSHRAISYGMMAREQQKEKKCSRG